MTAQYKPLKCPCCKGNEAVTFGHISGQKLILKKTKNRKTHTLVIDRASLAPIR
jgi:hypothetical protein